MLGQILTEDNFSSYVASDIAVGDKFLPQHELETQSNLDQIAIWSDLNIMKLTESKIDHMLFTMARQPF